MLRSRAIQEFGIVANQWMRWRPRTAASQFLDRQPDLLPTQYRQADDHDKEQVDELGPHASNPITRYADALSSLTSMSGTSTSTANIVTTRPSQSTSTMCS